MQVAYLVSPHIILTPAHLTFRAFLAYVALMYAPRKCSDYRTLNLWHLRLRHRTFTDVKKLKVHFTPLASYFLLINSEQNLSIIVNALAAAGDVLIAGILCILLHRSRTGFQRYHSLTLLR
jgi:hypothetical protein